MSEDLKKNKDSSRYCLLRSAAKLFCKNGLEKTSTRDIAQESKVNISMISYHFGGKEGLYKQVLMDFAKKIEAGSSEILESFAGQEMTKESFKKEMTAIIDHIIQNRIKNPEICTMLSREKIEGMPLSQEIHEQIFYPLILKFLDLMTSAQEKKFIRADINPALFFILMSEGIFGFFEVAACNTKLSEKYKGLVDEPENLRNQIVKIYLEGILL
ncbi:MAG: TetR family transcriptional regulator [Bdellovibrionaceae bacterium]|nr:TetR family transcriptional regulator [Pseudobdellovibrionaceae bacterium]